MKYKVIKKVEKRNWMVGDIVEVVNQTGDKLEDGILIPYEDELPANHTLLVASPLKISNKINQNG